MLSFRSANKLRSKTTTRCIPNDGIDKCSLAWAFSTFPFLILFLTLGLGLLATWAGISQHGFPEFQDPYLGFETRGTKISSRIIALKNLRTENRHLELVENYPGERIGSRESRKKRDPVNRLSYCSEDPHNIIGKLCYYQKLLESSEQYQYLCEKDGNSDCCPIWSLPNYVAKYSNLTDCMDLKEDNVKRYFEDLHSCIIAVMHDSSSSSSAQGIKTKCHGAGELQDALDFTLEANFRKTNMSEYVLLILPVPKNPAMPIFLEEFQNYVQTTTLPDDAISLAGFDFGTKDELFKTLLISDLRYVIGSSVAIFVVVWMYTRSFFVTIVSYAALTLTLGVSYFFYRSVICVPYFPFMNMLVTIIVLGIGIDGTLIMSVAWRRCRHNLKDELFNKQLKYSIMKETLNETTSTLVITTCTTACAFLASLTSSVTTIKCFSIFAGTSIITSFLLIYIAVPTSLLASDIMWKSFRETFLSSEGRSTNSKILGLQQRLNLYISVIRRWKIRARLTKAIEVLTISRWACLTCTILTGALVWSLVAVLYSPGFELPNSEQFQLLSHNHPVEKYDHLVEPRFTEHQHDGGMDNLTFYFVWGIKDSDGGSYLDPNDDGSLEFDPEFSMSHNSSQKWMRKFCKRLKNQTFYDIEANLKGGAKYDSCMLESLIEWMKRDCADPISATKNYEPCCKVSRFPYEPAVFDKCVGSAARGAYNAISAFFKTDVSGFKFFTTKVVTSDSSEDPHTSYGDGIRVGGRLAAYVMRVRTGFQYSLSYEKMSSIFHEVERFFETAKQTVPSGLKNGFQICSLMDFFDLQHSLLNDTWYSLLLSTSLCFVFILASSRSVGVSIGAVICILSIVVVSSSLLITLFDWKLGVFEAIAVTVAVGLSDFTAHHSIEYAKRKSIVAMTSPTFYSAVATVTTGLTMMIFSDVLVYQQIGSFFVVLVVTSWTYSVFFLTPILKILDETESVVTKHSRRWFAYWISIINVRQLFSNILAQMRKFSCRRHILCLCKCLTETKVDFAQAADAVADCAVIEGSGIQVIHKEDADACPDIDTDRNPQMMETLKLLKKVGQETTV